MVRKALTAGFALAGVLAGPACAPGRAAGPPPTTAPVSTTARAAAPTTIRATTTSTGPAAPPYAVGSVRLALVDPSRPTVSHGRRISASRALTTLVWFPRRPGPWPLVVFAHGYAVGPEPYESMLEAWATHGYVVAAPELPLDDPAVAGPNLDEADIDNLPGDLRFVTDQLVARGGTVASRIDPSRVAVAGHSDGAEAALAAAVAPPPTGQPPYRAVLVLGGQPIPGGAGHNPPMLVVQGDADTINPPSYGYTTWADGASPKYLLVMHGAGHLPPYQAGSRWLAGVEAATEAFFDAYLAGDRAPASVTGSVTGLATMSMRAA